MEIQVKYNCEDTIPCVVYKITFPNKKVYIGQTSVSLRTRIKQHTASAIRGVNKGLYSAIRKYKYIEVDILKECSSIEELNYWEKLYISEYNCTLFSKLGYNTRPGGKNTKMSEETKNKISKSLEKTKIERGKKISKALKNNIQNRDYTKNPETVLKWKETYFKNRHKHKKLLPEQYVKDEIFKNKVRETLKNKPDRICPHCNKVGRGSNMTRWHFDNCKLKNSHS
jgi:hypothetical protein